MRLLLNDYISILKYYDIDVSNMKKKAIKQKAEAILAEKLCRCIKKVSKSLNNKKESRAIAICKNSVFTKKNLKVGRFKCKERSSIKSLVKTRNTRNTLKKH